MIKEEAAILYTLNRTKAEAILYNQHNVSTDGLKILACLVYYGDRLTKKELLRLINFTGNNRRGAVLFRDHKARGFIIVDVVDKITHYVRVTAKGSQMVSLFSEILSKEAERGNMERLIYRKKIKPKTGRPAHPVICQGCIESFPPDQVRYIVNGFYCGECATEAGESGE
jgi:hypothetical protein